MLTVFVTRRSAVAAPFTVAAALLLSGFGSIGACADTEALFATAPGEVTVATSVSVADAVALSAPTVQVPAA